MRIQITILLLLISLSAFAQQGGNSRAELEKRRQGILQSIRETQEQLEITKQDKKATLSQLRALQAKLAARQKLIGNINDEIGEIDKNIHTSTSEVSHLQNNLEDLKARYAQSLRYAYRTRSTYSMMAFLFSSNNFNDAIRRLKYLKKYRDFRKEQADKIRVTQGQIKQKIGALNNQKSQKSILLTAEEQQKQVLQNETNQTNHVAQELKGREKELLVEIAKSQKAKREIDRTINRIIQHEIELARKKAEEDRRRAEELRRRQEEEQRKAALAAKNNASGVKLNTGSGMKGESEHPPVGPSRPTTVAANEPSRPAPKPAADLSYKMMLAPEVAALSEGFENNRGRLPWPVDKGFISGHFGIHKHPLAEKVNIENNGVIISTPQGTTVRAAFDGKVTAVFSTGVGITVMISHGQYFTVYGGLSSVSVKKDQVVHTKQPIGVVGQNDEGETVIDFQIWKVGSNNQSSKLNPEGWIAK